MSCGSSTRPKDTTSQLQKFKDLEELTNAYNNQTVYCGVAQNDCPGFAAKLAYWFLAENGKYYLGSCSGTLYQNKYILTNSHCIPSEIKRAGAICSDQIKVLFPYTKRLNAQSVRCARVIQVYQQDKGQPDLAVLEMEKVVSRDDDVVITKNNFIENSKVYAYTMNPNSYDRNIGTITLKRCTLSVDNAFTMSNLTSSSVAILSGNDCNVISGNSGSGLFNEKGEYLGAVYAKIDIEKLRDVFSIEGINHSVRGPIGVAQNIGCLNSLTSNSGITCNIRTKNVSDIEAYIERVKNYASLGTENEALINYEITDGFQLKLTKAKFADSRLSVESFRQKWRGLFSDQASSLSSDERIIKR